MFHPNSWRRYLRHCTAFQIINIWSYACSNITDPTNRSYVLKALRPYLSDITGLRKIHTPFFKVPFTSSRQQKALSTLIRECILKTKFPYWTKKSLLSITRLVCKNRPSIIKILNSSQKWMNSFDFENMTPPPCCGHPECTEEKPFRKRLAHFEGTIGAIGRLNASFIPQPDSNRFKNETLSALTTFLNYLNSLVSPKEWNFKKAKIRSSRRLQKKKKMSPQQQNHLLPTTTTPPSRS